MADARAMDAAGAYSLWVGPADGAVPGVDPVSPGPDSLIVLGAIAAVTSQARLGVMLPTAPALDTERLVHLIAALQRLSRGRVMLALPPGQQAFVAQLREGLARQKELPDLPILIAGGDDRSVREAGELAGGLICSGAPAAMEPVFRSALEVRPKDRQEQPFECWVQVATPADGAAWREVRKASEAAGATGLLIPLEPRLLDMVRLGDEKGEVDRSDLQLSYG